MHFPSQTILTWAQLYHRGRIELQGSSVILRQGSIRIWQRQRQVLGSRWDSPPVAETRCCIWGRFGFVVPKGRKHSASRGNCKVLLRERAGSETMLYCDVLGNHPLYWTYIPAFSFPTTEGFSAYSSLFDHDRSFVRKSSRREVKYVGRTALQRNLWDSYLRCAFERATRDCDQISRGLQQL